ncbi:methyl-accepting chemotaxis protein [Calothrix sp. PCC 6303]|uniref:methyl-accepting chemotaxis protein n=1 Tax=Calothrix sp. PCC 6303 TaxID=1170562 RepID=UPI0002A01561|nr:methyl-accepting chemotaxis protein [Calothrix sp. PCC 6303]AFZ02393.1 methyl-accepting chemotaxis sensory transducer [Calothrix sp. PCC 6303]
MAASIDDDYAQIYQQALTAYAKQSYEEAAALIDQVVQNIPSDPNTHLLRGHIYFVLQDFDVAKAEYKQVLDLTKDPEITSFAKNGLESIVQYQQPTETNASVAFSELSFNTEASVVGNSTQDFLEPSFDLNNDTKGNNTSEDLSSFGNLNADFDLSVFSDSGLDSVGHNSSVTNPFDLPADSAIFGKSGDLSQKSSTQNPFATNPNDLEPESNGKTELPGFWQEDISLTGGVSAAVKENTTFGQADSGKVDEDFSFSQFDLPSGELGDSSNFFLNSAFSPETTTEKKLNVTSIDEAVKAQNDSIKNDNLASNSQESSTQGETKSTSGTNTFSTFDLTPEAKATTEVNDLEDNHNFDFEAFESAFGADSLIDVEKTGAVTSGNNTTSNNQVKQNNIEFLDDFDDFDDLGNIPGFDLTNESSFGDSQLRSNSFTSSKQSSTKASEAKSVGQQQSGVKSPGNGNRDDELFSITASQEAMPIFTNSDVSKIEPHVNFEQGFLAPLENAPLPKKQWFIAGAVGIASTIAAAIVSYTVSNFFANPEQRQAVQNTGFLMALVAGVTGGATAGVMGSLSLRPIRRSTQDLQTQFDLVRQGNLNVQATVYSEDEFGHLAAGFNEMTRVIFTTTNEATRKAQEQEEAKENLQRQVIRLLDDVEGAARGDLTVQAEVTADVLGAVADAFNLTIQNLRDIVQQVKVAAREVTKGATNSETFARALSTDALRQAEELAVTLNSVQVMTDSIQRVAEAAREAETVARDASAIAIKGGEAVENTVAGILEIRETVAETTRKVKRLAESSQEISKIVALISQIASRTNLLALNASIEAARAGEAGRGFAIVADEVRQLADKSAKSLKEIEQIVMQIQSETSSVMTAMEEGTQQVIQGTKLAEEAKRSLDNIIQVANRIDTLVCSITADTVDQTDTSRAVAQVMQSVELTAQETSQEAQRVSGALQHLVGVSRDLIASVERFRVETAESR